MSCARTWMIGSAWKEMLLQQALYDTPPGLAERRLLRCGNVLAVLTQ